MDPIILKATLGFLIMVSVYMSLERRLLVVKVWDSLKSAEIGDCGSVKWARSPSSVVQRLLWVRVLHPKRPEP